MTQVLVRQATVDMWDGGKKLYINTTCDNCGKSIRIRRWRYEMFAHVFCSRVCNHSYAKGKPAVRGVKRKTYKVKAMGSREAKIEALHRVLTLIQHDLNGPARESLGSDKEAGRIIESMGDIVETLKVRVERLENYSHGGFK